MRTQAEWEEHYQLMKAAESLADFARLESEDDVKRFQDDHSDFVPANWWVKSNWIRERDLLLKAWKAGFPADLTIKLTTSYLFGEAHLLAAAGIPADKSNPITVHMIRGPLDNFEGRALVGLAPNPRILGPDGTDITAEVKKRTERDRQIWSYQRAVLFLHIHPKQAKICSECEKPFVSESSNAQWCQYIKESENGLETTCARTHRKAYKHELWQDKRDEGNAVRREDYAAKKKTDSQVKTRKNRSSHAKRKNLRQR